MLVEMFSDAILFIPRISSIISGSFLPSLAINLGIISMDTLWDVEKSIETLAECEECKMLALG